MSTYFRMGSGAGGIVSRLAIMAVPASWHDRAISAALTSGWTKKES